MLWGVGIKRAMLCEPVGYWNEEEDQHCNYDYENNGVLRSSSHDLSLWSVVGFTPTLQNGLAILVGDDMLATSSFHPGSDVAKVECRN